MFAAHAAFMTGALPPVVMSYSTSSSAMPTHSAGDMLVAIVQISSTTTYPITPTGWTVLQQGGGGQQMLLKTVYKVATSSSEAWPNYPSSDGSYATACFAFKNATRIRANSYYPATAQYPNGARPYVYALSMLDPSGNSYVLGWCDWSSGLNFSGTSFTNLVQTGQENYFYATSTQVTTIPAQYIAASSPSYFAQQNYNSVVFEIAN